MKNEVNRALVAKKKLTILFALLTLSAGLWAETINGVKYIDANGQEQTADNVTVVTGASATLSAGWYVVKGTDVRTGGLVCNGAVHLILADGAKLTSTGTKEDPGIQVFVEGNSLTIYGQANQSGQLIATGGDTGAAGIGGREFGNGSNITINGGLVIANGGNGGAGIGGGFRGSGSNITINGGTVTATGGKDAAGIGGGFEGSGSNIKVATNRLVKAGEEENPTEEIATDRTDDTDIASDLAGKRYVTVGDNPAYNAGYARGLEEGKAAAKAELPTDPEGTAGHTVTITKGDKTLILVNPDKVTYGKQEQAQ